VKQDDKETNHASYASNIDVNASYMNYHAFDASYVLMKNKFDRVIALYVGPHHKRPKTCMWVPKVLVTNIKGSKQVWVHKTNAWFFLVDMLLRWNKLVLDSRCTDHMTGEKKMLTFF
jgi:hypothetical protein